MKPSLLFYCQHSLGLGHLVRSLALVDALRRRFRVVLVAGGEVPEQVAAPADVEVVRLPPLAMDERGAVVSRDPRVRVGEAHARRRELLGATLRAVRPDVVVVELFPFGRKKFTAELVPLLEEARAQRPRPVVVSSVRDILVGRRDQVEHDERSSTIANWLFDAVLVHADPAFARLEDSFRPRTPLEVPVLYTGFVAPARPSSRPAGNGGPVVVSAGGGFVGRPLLRAAVEAQRIVWPATRVPMRVVAGPLLPEPEWRALRDAGAGRPGLDVVRSVDDLAAELASARASISQCGYNTALELLWAQVPALVVPYGALGEDEQRRRAARLLRLGAVRALHPRRLTARTLAAELAALLEFEPRPLELRSDGAESTTSILGDLVAKRAPVAA